MRFLAYAYWTVILLSACGKMEHLDAPVNNATPASIESLASVPGSRAPTEISAHKPDKSFSAAEKIKAKAEAIGVLNAIERAAALMENSDAMHDYDKFSAEFLIPLATSIKKWPAITDDRYTAYGVLNSCQEAGSYLLVLGEGINRNEDDRLLVSSRDYYLAARPECEQAIRLYK